MMKNRLLFTGLLLTTLLFGIYVNAEEKQNNEIDQKQTTQSQETNETSVDTLETAKNDAISKIKDMYTSQMISEKERDNFFTRIKQATKIDEIDGIMNETEKIIKNNFLEITKNDVSFVIKKWHEEQKISEREMDDFLNRLNHINTIEEAYALMDEVKEIVDKNGSVTESSSISNEVKDSKEGNKIIPESSSSNLTKDIPKESEEKNLLPKTGESGINERLIGIGFILILFFMSIKFRPKKNN